MPRLTKKLRLEQSYATGRYTVAPEFVSLVVTFRCFFHCESCSIWKKTEFPQLSDAEWLQAAEAVTQHFPPETFVEINGGEPLIRRELVIGMVRILKRHFRTVALNSNGLLIDEKIIHELEETGLDIMKISFYSLIPDVHNTLRGNAEAYNKARAAIERLAQSTIKPEVGILVTRRNIAGVPKLIDYLRTLQNVSIIIQPLDESVESVESKDVTHNHLLAALWPEPAGVREVFGWIKRNNGAVKNAPANIAAIEAYYLNPPAVLRYRCFAGQRSVVLYPNGDVAMCFKGNTLGNVTCQDLKDILSGASATAERAAIRTCTKYCRIIGCNFSRGFREYMADRLGTPVHGQPPVVTW